MIVIRFLHQPPPESKKKLNVKLLNFLAYLLKTVLANLAVFHSYERLNVPP